jgi:hypothetical protein
MNGNKKPAVEEDFFVLLKGIKFRSHTTDQWDAMVVVCLQMKIKRD